MYPNLELEMFKAKITSKELAKNCGISEGAMRNKRKGRTALTLDEAEAIKALFPNCAWDYLFDRGDDPGASA